MTMRSNLLSGLIASIPCRVPAGAARAWALAAMLAGALATGPAHAQLIDSLYASDQPIGSAAVRSEFQMRDTVASESSVVDDRRVLVGPGGPTSTAEVPSALGQSSVPQRTKLVNQPWAAGPFMQANPVYESAGMPCPVEADCDFTYYGSAEALYFRREYDERFSLSQNTFIPPFDYEWAGRVTVGQVADCVNGYEFVYAGPFKFQRDSAITSLGGNLQSRLVPNGFLPLAVSAFNNANTHVQTYQARMNTFEVNRRWWQWDIFSVLLGMRFVDYREHYAFVSNGAGGLGIYEDFTRNRMIGPQIGGEVMQPFGMRTLLGFRGKGAVLANFSRNQIALQNAGLNVLGAQDSDVDVAGLIEFGAFAKYSVTRSIRLTGGYEFWYLPGTATVASQGLNIVGPGTGAKVDADDDLLLHGASFGAQILY